MHSKSKVPQITLMFWVVKIAATTLGETAGDTVSMTLHSGYAMATFVFSVFFALTLLMQVRATSFHPFIYWSVIIATTTLGTTMADFADRTLGIGYIGGSSLLATLLLLTLAAWRKTCGSIAVTEISSRQAEVFYWLTILCSNTLGTALGDFLAADSGFGYLGSTLIFLCLLTLTTVLYCATHLSHTLLFWLAFILTRPLGATVGDLLTKPLDEGGMDLSRMSSSLALSIFMVVCIWVTSRNTHSPR